MHTCGGACAHTRGGQRKCQSSLSSSYPGWLCERGGLAQMMAQPTFLTTGPPLWPQPCYILTCPIDMFVHHACLEVNDNAEYFHCPQRSHHNRRNIQPGILSLEFEIFCTSPFKCLETSVKFAIVLVGNQTADSDRA